MKTITGYVLVDESDDSIIGNYDKYDKSNAILDAKDAQKNNKNGCYIVYECVDGVFDEKNSIYKSSNIDGKF